MLARFYSLVLGETEFITERQILSVPEEGTQIILNSIGWLVLEVIMNLDKNRYEITMRPGKEVETTKALPSAEVLLPKELPLYNRNACSR